MATSAIKIGTAVATAVLTGGAGAGLIGAQAASTLSTINTTIGAVRCGLEAGAALENGDYQGALTSGLGALAGFNQVGGALGVSDDVLQVTRAVADHGQTAANVLADGKIDASDLQHLPVGDILGKIGLDDVDPKISEAVVTLAKGVASGQPEKAIIDVFATQIADYATDCFPNDPAKAAEAELALRFVGDMITTGSTSPQTMDLMERLLQQAARQPDEHRLGELPRWLASRVTR